jgi:hypothetical protein
MQAADLRDAVIDPEGENGGPRPRFWRSSSAPTTLHSRRPAVHRRGNHAIVLQLPASRVGERASRVYAGIHFRSACRDGVKVGRKIGQFTMQHVLKPLD